MQYEESNLNNYQQVPQLVSNLINLIGEMEPVEGVFRVNGGEKNILDLINHLDQGIITIYQYYLDNVIINSLLYYN
jgi:hypothetical protein